VNQFAFPISVLVELGLNSVQWLRKHGLQEFVRTVAEGLLDLPAVKFSRTGVPKRYAATSARFPHENGVMRKVEKLGLLL
jgi:hypothetical protein